MLLQVGRIGGGKLGKNGRVVNWWHEDAYSGVISFFILTR